MTTPTLARPSRGPLTTSMNPERKAEWLAALKSGKYRQGKHVLATAATGVKRHCCLGVLCELAVEAGVIQRMPSDSGVRYGDSMNGWELSTLPAKVSEWAGFNGGRNVQNPDVTAVSWCDYASDPEFTRSVSLAEINDETGPGMKAARRKVSLYKGDYSSVIPWIEGL